MLSVELRRKTMDYRFCKVENKMVSQESKIKKETTEMTSSHLGCLYL